jgi:hypothetical protein
MTKLTVIAALALALAAGVAHAQTPPPAAPATAPAAKPAAAPATTAPAAKEAKARTPESLKCSADADAKKLHGSERKKFREKCMKDAKKAAAPAEPAKKN